MSCFLVGRFVNDGNDRIALRATIQIYRAGAWVDAALFRVADPRRGIRGSCELEYDVGYAAQFAGPQSTRVAAISCSYPVDFELHQLPHWPAFLLDVLPNGYGREQWLEQLELADGAAADWPLLLRGTAFPPGNLRIKQAVEAKVPERLVPTPEGNLVSMRDHPGFTRSDVLRRTEAFVEYAFQHGIYAAGASDVQGIAPKLLLVQDSSGRWHAEGAVPDDRVDACWLVKRPRGKGTFADRKILRNEAAYMTVAQQMGLRVFSPLIWEEDTLFVPRFDRVTSPGSHVRRYGLESLYSLAGIAEYGSRVSHDRLCDALLKHSTSPEMDLLEYLKRDILNVVLGNKDNHGRNTAVLKNESGEVQLSPVFDFAPMYLDPEGIARVCRWEGQAERAAMPDWSAIVGRYADTLGAGRDELRRFGSALQDLPDIAQEAGVDDDIIAYHLRAIDDQARQLMAL